MLEELEEPYLSPREWIVIALVCIVLLPIVLPIIGVTWVLNKIGLIPDDKTA